MGAFHSSTSVVSVVWALSLFDVGGSSAKQLDGCDSCDGENEDGKGGDEVSGNDDGRTTDDAVGSDVDVGPTAAHFAQLSGMATVVWGHVSQTEIGYCYCYSIRTTPNFRLNGNGN